jgi:hypothetical protein
MVEKELYKSFPNIGKGKFIMPGMNPELLKTNLNFAMKNKFKKALGGGTFDDMFGKN